MQKAIQDKDLFRYICRHSALTFRPMSEQPAPSLLPKLIHCSSPPTLMIHDSREGKSPFCSEWEVNQLTPSFFQMVVCFRVAWSSQTIPSSEGKHRMIKRLGA
jgi:hypothetical protein